VKMVYSESPSERTTNESIPDVVRTSHIEYFVTDIEKSRDFYVESLGFVATESSRSQIYLRGLEDRSHHCLILTKRDKPAVGHVAFRVRRDADLDLVARLLEKDNLPYKWLKHPAREEKGLGGRVIRAQDPFGFPLEFFRDMEEVDWLHQRFDRHLRAKIMRIDHVNMFVTDVSRATEWYMSNLGFYLSEYTETEDKSPKFWATWLRRKPTVHDIALMTGRGPRIHHTGFVVAQKDVILDCADVLASKGYLKNMERGPGRHGISNAFFLYLRDPDGHRIELYTGDYLSADPDWKPLKWKLSDPQRQTFWGAPAPDSWFREASDVISVVSGKKVRTREPKGGNPVFSPEVEKRRKLRLSLAH
jgi:catechol 2,3-dioxygenase